VGDPVVVAGHGQDRKDVEPAGDDTRHVGAAPLQAGTAGANDILEGSDIQVGRHVESNSGSTPIEPTKDDGKYVAVHGPAQAGVKG
jgi:hypothetical protein